MSAMEPEIDTATSAGGVGQEPPAMDAHWDQDWVQSSCCDSDSKQAETSRSRWRTIFRVSWEYFPHPIHPTHRPHQLHPINGLSHPSGTLPYRLKFVTGFQSTLPWRFLLRRWEAHNTASESSAMRRAASYHVMSSHVIS